MGILSAAWALKSGEITFNRLFTDSLIESVEYLQSGIASLHEDYDDRDGSLTAK